MSDERIENKLNQIRDQLSMGGVGTGGVGAYKMGFCTGCGHIITRAGVCPNCDEYEDEDDEDRYSKPMTYSKTMRRIESILNEQKEEVESKINIATTTVDEARAYADDTLSDHGYDIDEQLPEFNENYQFIQNKIKRFALDIPRSEMPVIEPEDMDEFEEDLNSGHIDLFEPFAWDEEFSKQFPEMFASEEEKEEFLTLGLKDGDPTDDVMKAGITRVAAGDLIPLQTQIWLGIVIPNMINYGFPETGSKVLNVTIIKTREGYILDGHHRWAQVMLKDPDLEMKVLRVPLDIDTLLDMGKSWSKAVGRSRKT